jgi:phosphoribosylamine--glycine ligase
VGLASVEEDALVFHAGTRLDAEGGVVTSGGRVLTVAALGASLSEARGKAYRNIQHIHFSRCHYRRDIAAPAQEAVVE